MNWKKLSKQKKNQLVLIVVLAVAVLNGLGFGLIQFQYGRLKKLAADRAVAEQKLTQMRNAVKVAEKLEAELAESNKTLAGLEEDMASGDLYAWMINTVRAFKLGYHVEIPQFSPISSQGEMNLLPNFPYKQASVTVAGTSHFHDLGKFLADFENQFPHIRVVNLRVDANPTANAASNENQETVGFTMEIVALVKST
jgi:Tfp pilus assembly protein PilO